MCLSAKHTIIVKQKQVLFLLMLQFDSNIILGQFLIWAHLKYSCQTDSRSGFDFDQFFWLLVTHIFEILCWSASTEAVLYVVQQKPHFLRVFSTKGEAAGLFVALSH